MGVNTVRLSGTVKRDEVAYREMLTFALEVTDDNGYTGIFDCRMTERSAAFGKVEGFVEAGEHLEIIGHLEKVTKTDEMRVGTAVVKTRVTSTFVYVDDVIVEDDE